MCADIRKVLGTLGRGAWAFTSTFHFLLSGVAGKQYLSWIQITNIFFQSHEYFY